VGGPPVRNGSNFQRDDIQARIDNITNGSPDPNIIMGGFPTNGMGGMDMNPMGMPPANPILLQEMLMNQMAMMAQMATSMGMVNPNGQFTGGFPMQPGGMPGDMNMFNGNAGGMNGFPGGPQQQIGGAGRGRVMGRGRPAVRGRASTPHTNGSATNSSSVAAAPPAPVVAPTPTLATPANPTPPTVATSTTQQRLAFVPPERPQSPTLCKFGMKCTNAFCRWSHPSPVATTESGVVLTNEACDNGKNCKDKDCIKSHVSPAVNLPRKFPLASMP
jgi:nuclear polyadenylated RNA-binding protein NAB2